MSAISLRYKLPIKAVKGDCPQCGPRHRKTLSRYVDTRTGEPLPDVYGRCDRETNCTYHVSPYHKGPSGLSYADEVFQQWQADNPLPGKPSRRAAPQRLHQIPLMKPTNLPLLSPELVCTIPDEVFKRTIGHYDRNQFATLLRGHFGPQKADELLQHFQIGTSTYWPGATVFWLIDTDGKARAGQVNLFADDWHRAKYTDREGNRKPCISSISHGLLRHYRGKGEDVPDWLTEYHEEAPRWPIPFGLHQLPTVPADMPIAIVEACKTAVVCSGHFPQFVWLAIGAKSYPTTERLTALRNRRIMLYPDLNAYTDWSKRAEALRAEGFRLGVSSLLEDNATDEQRQKGLDLADFLLQPQEPTEPMIVDSLTDWAANPGSILRPDSTHLTFL